MFSQLGIEELTFQALTHGDIPKKKVFSNLNDYLILWRDLNYYAAGLF